MGSVSIGDGAQVDMLEVKRSLLVKFVIDVITSLSVTISMLTDFIKSMGLKRAEFASRLGIGRAYLSGLESGKKKPSLELAVKIDRLTTGRVPVDSWVDEPAEPNPHNESQHVTSSQT